MAAASGLAELRLEPVGLDGELGDGLDRRRQEGRFRGVRGAVGIDGNAVEGRAESTALTAADDHLRAASLRFRNGGHQVEDAAHRPTDHERELVDRFIRHVRRNLRVLGRHQRRVGLDGDRFLDGAEVQHDVHTRSRPGRQPDDIGLGGLETRQRRLDPVGAGRQIGGVVRARLRRHHVGGCVGRRVDDLYRDSRDGRLAGVLDDTRNAASFGLREAGSSDCERDGRYHDHHRAPDYHGSPPWDGGRLEPPSPNRPGVYAGTEVEREPPSLGSGVRDGGSWRPPFETINTRSSGFFLSTTRQTVERSSAM
jgi:hypothetical protein